MITIKMNKRIFVRLTSMILSAGLLFGCCAGTASAGVRDEDPMKYKLDHIKELTEDQESYKGASSMLSALKGSNKVKKIKGVDVSAWQGSKVNWKKAKKAGVRFAIIRTAYARLKTGKLHTDKCYKRNIVNASNAGIKVGAYIYSEAVTRSQAKREAEYIVKTLKPYKKRINMPVVMDVESAGKGTYWRRAWNAKKLSRKKVVENYKAFASVVKKAGYTPMFYTYSSFMFSYVDKSALKKTGDPFWLADYTGWKAPNYFLKHGGRNYPYEFWQYSSSVSVSGIARKTDVNYWYTSNINRFNPVTPQKKLTVSAKAASVNAVQLTWKRASGAKKYTVQRKVNGKFKNIRTVTALKYLDKGLKRNTGYYYRVIAVCKDKEKIASGTAFAKTPASDKKNPVADSSKITLKASLKNKKPSYTLSWPKVSGTDHYTVCVRNILTGKSITFKTKYISLTIRALSKGFKYQITITPFKNSKKGRTIKKVIVLK